MDAMGGWTPERRREILRDSRHGSFGVAAMAGTIILRVACIASLAPAAAFAGCVAAHGLGRAGAVAVMATAPPMTTEGLGADYVRSIRRPAALLGIAVAVTASIAAVRWWAGPLVAAVAIVAVIMTSIARRAFGGINGDVLGAVEQLGECVVLVVVSGLALRHPLWWS
jgi:adenosylcobinamide-GDP ribazoletransferase